jgi:hypothetical protein
MGSGASRDQIDVDLKVDGDPLPNTLAGCRDELLQLCNEVPGYKERLLDISKKHVAHARLLLLEFQIADMVCILSAPTSLPTYTLVCRRVYWSRPRRSQRSHG